MARSAAAVERSPAPAINAPVFELPQPRAAPSTKPPLAPQTGPVIILEPPVKSSAGPSDSVVLIGLLVLCALVGGVLAIAIAIAPPDMR